MTQPLSVIFCWHMHQPFYREADSGNYHLPWVYLHATKDYTDMAAVLREDPKARAVVNFVPSLTVQIEDYAARIRDWLDGELAQLPDPLLAALVGDAADYDADKRQWLLEVCFRLNHQRNLYRYPAYSRLWNLAEQTRHQRSIGYLGPNYFSDLVTWYHLGWLAETVRLDHFVARRLIEKGSGFNEQDRRDLLTLIASLLHDISGSYRQLAESGQIELSTTPYAHPILPLMIDFETARETVPEALIPTTDYPGGEARAEDHVILARDFHERVFGHAPAGCWPAEGGVSDAAVSLLGKHGFSWCATGEGVLRHSLKKDIRQDGILGQLYQPWLVGDRKHPTACFFRNDRLSDLIGFEYSRWDTHDAVANFMHELSLVRERTHAMKAPVVSIIMDGENAWEHYHENGVPFLKLLYQSIAEHPDYKLTTFSDYLKQHPPRDHLEHLVPGSWVYGNFSTWIGDAAKTRGWELLVEAKQAFDIHHPTLEPEHQQAALEQLRICEGSDWCWWFGDYNPGPAVRDFDQLYRQHLKRLYDLLGVSAPPSLDVPISLGGGEAEGGGTMRRGGTES
jgi:alpha-amylase/alpha-mannosidase (GH57 family)